MRLHVIVTLSILGIWFAPGHVWSQETPATLVVQVSNGTANGAPVAGDAVTLRLFRQQELLKSLEGMVGEDGKAVFEGLPTGDHTTALARVRHQDMSFQGRSVFLASTRTDYVVSVQVYDVSSDLSHLSVGTHHITVGIGTNTLELTEYIQLRNTSDMAVRGDTRDASGKAVVVEVALPAGFKDLNVSGYFEQSALVTTETGFYDTLAVPPGEHEVTFSYRIDIVDSSIDVVKALSLPTSEFELFWEGGAGRLEGLGQPDSQFTNAQGVPVDYYRRSNLKVGDKISFQVGGFEARASDSDTWMILAVVFGVMGAVVILRMVRKPAPSPPVD